VLAAEFSPRLIASYVSSACVSQDSFELDGSDKPVMTTADPSCRMPGNSAKMPAATEQKR
jgi:hypothetical protein